MIAVAIPKSGARVLPEHEGTESGGLEAGGLVISVLAG